MQVTNNNILISSEAGQDAELIAIQLCEKYGFELVQYEQKFLAYIGLTKDRVVALSEASLRSLKMSFLLDLSSRPTPRVIVFDPEQISPAELCSTGYLAPNFSAPQSPAVAAETLYEQYNESLKETSYPSAA